MRSTDVAQKAEILAQGRLLVPRGLKLPVPLSRSSAGPGAGGRFLFLRLGAGIVRLEVVRDRPAPLELRERKGGFDIFRNGRVLARGVQPLSAGFHAPGQAFINLHDSCRFRCAFCTISGSKDGPAPARWELLIKDALRSGRVQAVAITTGVPSTPSEACRDIARLTSSIRADFPLVPIGVEPYTVKRSDIAALRRAGADELKLNIQCATRSIFERVCPDLDWNGIWRNLGSGVRLFGRGNVCSNLIIGMGETDEDVIITVEKLAAMGVAANIRPLRTGPLNIEALERALGESPVRPTAARLRRLASAQKKSFERHGMRTSLFRTMCHRCTACDLEPFKDI
jgi:biotin synthase-related radical SAM superfamily protein